MRRSPGRAGGLATLARDSANKLLIEHRQLLLGTFDIHRHNAMIVERKDVELPRVGTDEASPQKLRVCGVLHEFDQGQNGSSRYPRGRKVPHWHCRAR
jgi:hypothetical protein